MTESVRGLMPDPIKYLSLCSGIRADKVAFDPLGWRAGAVSEIDPACCDLLAHYEPDVPNLGDMTAPDFIKRSKQHGPYDMVCGGTPCQAFSVAGKRGGLNDDRGNLTLRFVEICDAIDPTWILWENVPGVLSDKTNAFGCFLAGLVGADAPIVLPAGQRWTDAGVVAGPKRQIAWRVLDAQYFSLAQRRRRVFVLAGRAGTGADPSAVLFEPESVRRHTPPGREKGKEVAGTLGGGSSKRGWCSDLDVSGAFVPVAFNNRQDPISSSDVVDSLGAKDNGKGIAYAVRTAQTSANGHGVADNVAHTLDGANGQAVAFTQNQSGDVLIGDICPAMGTNQNATGRNTPKVMEGGQGSSMAVRRLTPL